MNAFKTFLLMIAMFGLFSGIGWLVGGEQGMMIAFGFALVMNFFAYWFSDKIVLAMYRAKPVTRQQAPQLYAMVSNLAARAKLPMPKVYIIPEKMANAFATGRDYNNSVVAVTSGILEILDEKELEAVLAHELSHIKNRDILVGAIAATFAAAITMLARFALFFGGSNNRGNFVALLAMMILAPLAAILIQMAISRSREYMADNGAAQLTGRPQSLISSLEKLHASAKNVRQTNAQPATAHMLIVNPFKGGGIASLFSTHPTLEQRKRNLLKR